MPLYLSEFNEQRARTPERRLYALNCGYLAGQKGEETVSKCLQPQTTEHMVDGQEVKRRLMGKEKRDGTINWMP